MRARAHTLTGCTRRQIITRVFFPSLPLPRASAVAYDFRNLYHDRPRNCWPPSKTAPRTWSVGKLRRFWSKKIIIFSYDVRRPKRDVRPPCREKLSVGRSKTTVGFFPRIRFIRFRYIAPCEPRARRRRFFIMRRASTPPPPPRGDRFFWARPIGIFSVVRACVFRSLYGVDRCRRRWRWLRRHRIVVVFSRLPQ